MCAVFKPSSHNPNLDEIDLNQNNTFSCVANTSGEQIKAYKLTVLSEDGTETIGDGYMDGSTYHSGGVDLLIPINNRKSLQIPNINSSFHELNKTFQNGKNYQWGVRVYNASIGSTAQPNTKVCEGFLVGSTKYVVWSKIPSTETTVLDQIVYDRYIEFTASGDSELIKGAHEPADKVKPTSYPFVQRQKIDFVTKELGTSKDYVKIETVEPFDWDYADGKEYSIYQCSSEHTVNSLFADPNSNINLTNYIIVYKTLANAQTARANGETPGDIKDTSIWADCMKKTDGTAGYLSRKLTGYSSDTGEMRVNDSFSVAPVNGQYYRVFKYDTVDNVYEPIDDEATEETDPLISHKVGGTPITNSTYFKTVTNRWDNNGVHRLFIQPNINIKSDSTNPNELVFQNGVRIEMVDQYWYNNGVKVDLQFNKLDNSQWLLEDNPLNTSGKTISAICPTGTSVPIISQTDYTVYTDFADSMPYNILYARKSPTITLQYRNALKELKRGRLSNNVFYDDTNTIIPTSEFSLYYNVPESKYYKWSVNQYVQVPSLLIEGKYINGEFVNESGTPYAKRTDWLYYDQLSTNYYLYSNNSYSTTTNIDVVWVNVNSPLSREYREVEFRALWQDENGNTVLDPQIKNYRYVISAYLNNETDTMVSIKRSKTYYSVETTWIFRGLDGTPTSYYTIENPHRYHIDAYITDEYDRVYTTSSDFKIFYQTENAPVSINVDLLCDEHANQVDISPPSYAESTDYNGMPTVTDQNLIADGGILIPNNHTLNYTQTTTDVELVFPKNFSMLTEFNITGDMIAKSSASNSETELLAICHELDNNQKEIFSFRADLTKTYNISQGQIQRNANFGHLFLYKKSGSDTSFSRESNCFYVNGAAQDYINLLNPAESSGQPQTVTLKNAIQTKGDSKYQIITTFPATPNLNTTYVLKQDLVYGGVLYSAGAYRATIVNKVTVWNYIVNEDYAYLDNVGQSSGSTYETLGVLNTNVVPPVLEGTKVSDTQWTYNGTTYNLLTEQITTNISNTYYSYKQGSNYYYWNGSALVAKTSDQLNFAQDTQGNYIWVDSGTTNETLKNYFASKTIKLFLRVSYDSNNTRSIKSQVLMVTN